MSCLVTDPFCTVLRFSIHAFARNKVSLPPWGHWKGSWVGKELVSLVSSCNVCSVLVFEFDLGIRIWFWWIQGNDVCATDENCSSGPEECELLGGQTLVRQDLRLWLVPNPHRAHLLWWHCSRNPRVDSTWAFAKRASHGQVRCLQLRSYNVGTLYLETTLGRDQAHGRKFFELFVSSSSGNPFSWCQSSVFFASCILHSLWSYSLVVTASVFLRLF